MSVLDDYRQKYPRYKDVPDEVLAEGIYNKHYAGKISFEEFSNKVGLSAGATDDPSNTGVDSGTGDIPIDSNSGQPSSQSVIEKIQATDPNAPLYPEMAGPVDASLTTAANLPGEVVSGLAGATVLATNHGDRDQAILNADQIAREGVLPKIPYSEAGAESMRGFAETISPATKLLERWRNSLGEDAYQSLGPGAGAMATIVPDLILEGTGAGLVPKAVGRVAARSAKATQSAEADDLLKSATPSRKEIKEEARSIYRELDDMDVTVSPKAYETLLGRIGSKAERMSIDADLTPTSSTALSRLSDKTGEPLTITELDKLRKKAQVAAEAKGADGAIGKMMVDEIDNFLDDLDPSKLETGSLRKGEVGAKYRNARELWRRQEQSKLIDNVFYKAQNQASGFENGLRTQFRAILNSDRKRRFFKPEELAQMEQVVQGTFKGNLFKLIGKLGFSEGQATQMVGTAIGAGSGAAIAGPWGAIAVPMIGQVSKVMARRLTERGAKFADQVVRAGNNAKAISVAYIRNTPKHMRSPDELAQLLMRWDIDLDAVPKTDLGIEAAKLAAERRALIAGASGANVTPIRPDEASGF